MNTKITRRAGGAIDFNGWHDPAKRVKRLQVIQGVALVLVCAVSVVVVLFLARAFDNSSARQEHAYAQLRQLTDVRAMMRDQQVQLVQRIAAGKSPATPSFFADYARFRALALSLTEKNAGGSSTDAHAARTAVKDAIAALDAGIQEALTHPSRMLEIANSLQGPGSPGELMEAGMDRWLDAASARVNKVVADGNAFTADLLRWVVAIVIALGMSGLLLWLGLDRARSRLVGTLHHSEQRFRALVKYSSDTVMIIDGEGVIRYASEPALHLCGYRPEELVGRALHVLVDPQDSSRMSKLASRGVASLQADEPIEWSMRHHNGSPRQVETICSTQIDDVVIDGFVLNTRDVTERREMEKELEHRAFHDVLTDLANRALFEDRVNHALAVAGPDAGRVAVMVLDLDDFKTVNDSLGHSAGDMLLVEAANRLRATLRATDTAARLGGDEFALLIERAGHVDELTTLADRIMATLREPVRIGGRDLVMRASLGIATATDASTTAASLLRDADLAMYVAKGRRQAGHTVFDPSMAQAASDRLGLMSALNGALARDEISLVYQPIMDLESGEMVAAEALMRWSGPDGDVEPSVFVPIAEETGLITTLGTWVLEEATRTAASWIAAGLPRLQISVNVSIRQLEQPGFADIVRRTLDAAGLPAACLTLEITESAAMRDPQTTLVQLAAVSALGVRIAIDDFGTGYSSLSYLARLPIDLVKIDRGFVAGLSVGKRDARLASMIVGIGQSLDLLTVAEGVENAAQVADLRELGCRLGQGYYFAAPLAAADLAQFARECSGPVPTV